MQTTLNLLDRALEVKTAAEWSRLIGVPRAIFTTAKTRGNLSPVVAGEVAAELGEDPQRWIVIAVMETAKESACKTKLMKRLKKVTSL
ncbi:hypothetical protein KDK82_0360 [Delftia sp. K82]|uniref:hypothetical protein n=1 Tax=Delftia sp. K82 TaxID=1472718 RepID=UPI000B48E64D|nr:hypothetical protein [Delftia sp. K82]OWG16899.1 hypothetical protein KDK82_0360 [Delftia sp. K82]